MTTITLTTTINAPITLCFDLSRSVTLHTISTNHTNESVISGRETGLFEQGDIVTWRARHFGFYQQLTMQISQMDRPRFFEDVMLKGIFKSIRHQHFFLEDGATTTMKDIFEYEVPFSIFGKLFDVCILKRYMTKLLEKRNTTIKSYAEQGMLV